MHLLKSGGFDGIDIDWEFPQNENEGQNFVLLLQAVRELLDAYSSRHASGHRFLLTIAGSAEVDKYSNMHLADMNRYLDFWNLMSYDFAEGWALSRTKHLSLEGKGRGDSITTIQS